MGDPLFILNFKSKRFLNFELKTLNFKPRTVNYILPFVVPIRRLSKNAPHFVDYKVN